MAQSQASVPDLPARTHGGATAETRRLVRPRAPAAVLVRSNQEVDGLPGMAMTGNAILPSCYFANGKNPGHFTVFSRGSGGSGKTADFMAEEEGFEPPSAFRR